MAAASKSKSMGLSIVVGIAIGTLAAILSSHVAVWLLAGIFVGIAAGASVGRKKCPECEAKELRAMTRAASFEPEASSNEQKSLTADSCSRS